MLQVNGSFDPKGFEYLLVFSPRQTKVTMAEAQKAESASQTHYYSTAVYNLP